MVASDSFAEFLREELAPLGRLSTRRMFGSTGVFCDGVMLGMVHENTLYFRVDDGNREAFKEASASPPLSYVCRGRVIDLSFWRAPERLFDEPDELVEWGRKALAAARRVAAKNKRTAPKKEAEAMIGYRARLGFLLPPGNPTVEAETMAMAPAGVSLHFQRMVGRGNPGAPDGQNERNRSMVEHIDESIEMLALVKPDIIVIAHTATSYDLTAAEEAALLDRLAERSGTRVTTAFASVAAALERLGVKRLSLGTPYSAETTALGKAHLEAHGIEVVHVRNLDVANIYDTTAEDAYRLARSIDWPEAEAVFLSGTGMPTVSVLNMLETDLQKPVISSNAAMMWLALRACGVNQAITGFGRLLTLD